MSNLTSSASASAGQGTETNVGTKPDIVIQSSWVNIHGETKLPLSVMNQVAASLSNASIEGDLILGGLIPLQMTTGDIIAGHEEEVDMLLAPFKDDTATTKTWYFIATLRNQPHYSYFIITHPDDDDETSTGTVEHHYTVFLSASGVDNLINLFTRYILEATNCKYDINRYTLKNVPKQNNHWVKLGHGTIVGLVRGLSANSAPLRDTLLANNDSDTPKTAVSLMPQLMPGSKIVLEYDNRHIPIPTNSDEWKKYHDIDHDEDLEEIEREFEAESEKRRARRKKSMERAEREVNKIAQSRSIAAGNKVRSHSVFFGRRDETSL